MTEENLRFPDGLWAEGWNLRFGLIEVNPATQQGKLRRSGELYSEICTANALSKEIIERYTAARPQQPMRRQQAAR